MIQKSRKWADVVSIVEKAHLQQIKNIQNREKERYRNYIQSLDRQIDRQQQQHIRNTSQKYKQRQFIEQQARREKQKREKEKIQIKKRQLQYKDKNMGLIELNKTKMGAQFRYRENPFVKLVDQQNKRKQNYRNSLKIQNQINFIQEKIKTEQHKERRKKDIELRTRFMQEVENHYQQQQHTRNMFKNKYLKITNPEKQTIQINYNQEEQQQLQKQYSSFLHRQIELKKQNQLKQGFIDQQLNALNNKIDIPDSSPAFLGRIPINHDRRLQLNYLDNTNKKQSQFGSRLMTEGNTKNIQIKRSYGSQMNQIPILQKYYNRLHQNSIDMTRQNRIKTQGNQANENKQLDILCESNREIQKYYTANNTIDGNEMCHSDNKSVKKDKRVYMTYDIIQGKRKYVYV